MVLTKPLSNPRYKHFFPEKDPNSLGIIMGVQGPNFGPLTLYGPSGELNISVSFLQKLTLKEDLLNRAKDFHAFAFNKVNRFRAASMYILYIIHHFNVHSVHFVDFCT